MCRSVPPELADDETTLDALIERLDRSSMFVRSIKPEQLAAASSVTMRVDLMGREERLAGDEYLRRWLVPKVIAHRAAMHATLARKAILVGKSSLWGRLEFLPPDLA